MCVTAAGETLLRSTPPCQYDELVNGELTAYLAGCSEEALDVIVSADTLVFFGSLEAVVIASEKALRPGGRLIFTVEELVGAEGYAIGTSGRYRHAHDYVRQALEASNLRAEIVSAEVRLEAGEPVAGFVDRVKATSN